MFIWSFDFLRFALIILSFLYVGNFASLLFWNPFLANWSKIFLRGNIFKNLSPPHTQNITCKRHEKKVWHDCSTYFSSQPLYNSKGHSFNKKITEKSNYLGSSIKVKWDFFLYLRKIWFTLMLFKIFKGSLDRWTSAMKFSF